MVAVKELIPQAHVYDDKAAVINYMSEAGIADNRLPAMWEENGRFVVGSSAVHRIPRAAIYSENPKDVPPKYNIVRPQPILASAQTPENAWRLYRQLTTSYEASSCLRLETPSGPAFVRIQEPAPLTAHLGS